jgi:spoIIIJ-associated protein
MATQTHEFKAKTVDDAIEEGLRTLALSRGDVSIEIIQKGSRGIFGLGSEPAIVRLTPRPVSSPIPTVSAPAEVAPLPVDEAPAAAPDPSAEAAQAEAEVVQPALAEAEQATDTQAELATEVVVPLPAQSQAQAELTATIHPSAASASGEDEADQELMEMAADLLREMVHLMGFQAEVRASWQVEDEEPADDHEEDEEEAQLRSTHYLLLDVEGADLGALIGRRGETLENMQYLLRLMVNQKIHKWKNIVIDVEHYKARRVTQLTQLAERMAEQVARTGRSISLEPMPANERRIVHMVLRNHHDVYTESYGDGGRRKVHIFAKS